MEFVGVIFDVCCWLCFVDLEILLIRYIVVIVVLCDSLDQCRGQVEVLIFFSKNLMQLVEYGVCWYLVEEVKGRWNFGGKLVVVLMECC